MKKYIIIFILLGIFGFDGFVAAMEQKRVSQSDQIISYLNKIFTHLDTTEPISPLTRDVINEFHRIYDEKGLSFTKELIRLFIARLISGQSFFIGKASHLSEDPKYILKKLLDSANELFSEHEVDPQFKDLIFTRLSVFEGVGENEDLWSVFRKFSETWS